MKNKELLWNQDLNLEELSLYVEICTYEKMMDHLRYDATIIPGNNSIQFQNQMTELQRVICLYKKQLEKFGIDPNSEEEVHSWKSSCQNCLSKLDIIEYAIFWQMRTSYQTSDLFYSADDDQSKKKESSIQKSLKVMKNS